MVFGKQWYAISQHFCFTTQTARSLLTQNVCFQHEIMRAFHQVAFTKHLILLF